MENKDPLIESMPLCVKTKQEVADEYGTSIRTLNKKLKEKGILLTRERLFPDTLKIIYSALGVPAGIKHTKNKIG